MNIESYKMNTLYVKMFTRYCVVYVSVVVAVMTLISPPPHSLSLVD